MAIPLILLDYLRRLCRRPCAGCAVAKLALAYQDARIAQLEEALQPFLCASLDPSWLDTNVFNVPVKVGDLRRVQEVLAGKLAKEGHYDT